MATIKINIAQLKKMIQEEIQSQTREKCPSCNGENISVRNPSNPIIYKCNDCKYSWNPDNVKFDHDGKPIINKQGFLKETIKAIQRH